MEIFNKISLEQLYASKLYIHSYVQTKLHVMHSFIKHVFLAFISKTMIMPKHLKSIFFFSFRVRNYE